MPMSFEPSVDTKKVMYCIPYPQIVIPYFLHTRPLQFSTITGYYPHTNFQLSTQSYITCTIIQNISGKNYR